MNSFLQSLIEKGRDLIGKLERNQRHVIQADRFDQNDWARVRKHTPIDKDIDEAKVRHGYVNDLYFDVFNLFHQTDPMLRDLDQMDSQHATNWTLVHQLSGSSDVQGLRQMTANDSYSSAMAMMACKSKILEGLDALKDAAEQQQEQMAQAQQQAQQAAQALQQALDQAQSQSQQGQPQSQQNQNQGQNEPSQDNAAQDVQQALEQAVAQAEQAAQQRTAAAQQLTQGMQQAAANAAAAIRPVLHQTAKDLEEEFVFASSWGLGPGQLEKMDIAERLKLMERLRNNRMVRFAKLIGQFRVLQIGESRRKVTHAPDQISSVTTGSDLTRLTTDELVHLASPELELDFWRRYAAGELFVYKLSGRERMSKGPIIVVLDESGSMAMRLMADGSTREAWSKALALALLEQAKRGRRDFHHIGFSDRYWEARIPRGQFDLETALEIGEHFYNGGTEYEPPLRRALQLVEEAAAAGHPKPDIVFITDGSFYESPELVESINEARKEHSLRVFGILVDAGEPSKQFQAVCDDVRVIDKLVNDPTQVADLFRII